jgi:lactoylglutathione lyase
MITINHTAVYVRDLEKTKAFYEKHFNATANAQYHNPKTGLRTYFLTFEGGSRLEIMTKPNLPEIDINGEYLGFIHIAFSVGSSEEVDRLTETLRSDGYTVFSEPRTTGDGYYESCVCDPDGNRIEIVA